MTTEEKLDWFDRYHQGTLTDADLSVLEKKLEQDPAFRSEFRLWLEMAEALSPPDQPSPIQTQIDAARRRFQEKEISRKSSRTRLLWFLFAGLCLAVVLVLALGRPRQHSGAGAGKPTTLPPRQDSLPADSTDTTFEKPKPPVAQQFPDKNRTSPRSLATVSSDFYQKSPINSIFRNSSDPENTPVERAKKHLDQGQFQEALDAIANADADDEEAIYLRGHALFCQNNYPAAAGEFSKISQRGGFRQQAQWFYLLSRLAASAALEPEVKILLDQIANDSSHPYRELARDLKQAL